jgi:hypothetical protein
LGAAVDRDLGAGVDPIACDAQAGEPATIEQLKKLLFIAASTPSILI